MGNCHHPCAYGEWYSSFRVGTRKSSHFFTFLKPSLRLFLSFRSLAAGNVLCQKVFPQPHCPFLRTLMVRWVRGDARFFHLVIFRCLFVPRACFDVLISVLRRPDSSERENLLLSMLCSPDAVVLTDRFTMARTPHPVSLATTHVTTCWARSLTVHQIACGWSSTATPPEPIRASASHTPVSCLINKVLSRGGKARCFLLYLCLCSRGFFKLLTENKNFSLILFFSLTQAHRGCKYNSLKLK